MCLALPMEVVATAEGTALCCGRNGEEWVDTRIVGPLAPGQWVLCHLGAAREVVTTERAAQVGAALAALEGLLNGTGDPEALVATHFADLVERQP